MKIDIQQKKPVSPVLAALYGAVISLLIGFAGSYLLTRFGFGVISCQVNAGPAVLPRAALNLYAIQHVTLNGSGVVQGAKVAALISLPLTVWIVVPVLALMAGGYLAARSREAEGQWKPLASALAAGILYAAVLTIAAPFIRATLDSYLMPEINGASANPPLIPFHYSAASTMVYAGLFGVCFSYLGALVAVRGRVRSLPDRWWACAKACIGAAVLLQLIMAVAFVVIVLPKAGSDGESPRITEMLPTAAGIGYALMNGATLESGVESRYSFESGSQRPFYAKVNLYRGITRRDQAERSHKPVPMKWMLIAAFVTAVVMLLTGILATRFGSNDGAAKTALRVLVIQALYLAALMGLCSIGLAEKSAISSIRYFITPEFSYLLAPAMIIECSLVMLGAHSARPRPR